MREMTNHMRAQMLGVHNKRQEQFTNPHQTIPGQSVPLKTLLERYTLGQDVKTFAPEYDGTGDVPINIERMDPMERLDAARQIKEAIEAHRRKPAPQPAPDPHPKPEPPTPPAPPGPREKETPPEAS